MGTLIYRSLSYSLGSTQPIFKNHVVMLGTRCVGERRFNKSLKLGVFEGGNLMFFLKFKGFKKFMDLTYLYSFFERQRCINYLYFFIVKLAGTYILYLLFSFKNIDIYHFFFIQKSWWKILLINIIRILFIYKSFHTLPIFKAKLFYKYGLSVRPYLKDSSLH